MQVGNQQHLRLVPEHCALRKQRQMLALDEEFRIQSFEFTV
mgnify:CR=1 FL=1